MSDTVWIRVYSAHDALEAQVVASALSHHGLDVQLRPAGQSSFGAALPTLDAPPTIWVPEDQVEEARTIIEAGESASGRLSFAGEDDGTVAITDDDPTG